jgi:hypothetical protein
MRQKPCYLAHRIGYQAYRADLSASACIIQPGLRAYDRYIRHFNALVRLALAGQIISLLILLLGTTQQ